VHQAFLSILENLDKISNVECPKTQSYIVIIVERKAIDTIMVILQKNLLKFLI